MVNMELYHNDMSTCAQKVRCQLAAKDLEWTGHALNLRAGDQHRPEFLKLNPKGVVPVLVDDGQVVTESNIIMEYLEDAFPDRVRLRPADAAGRAAMRTWMQRLDAGLHLDIAVVSIGIAFRHQLTAVHRTPDQLEAYYDAMPDEKLRAVYRQVVPHGSAAAPFKASLSAWRRTLGDMETALADRDFLAGGALTLADLAILPYVVRLEHLQLGRLWSGSPRVAGWFSRMKTTRAFERGIGDWLNPQYLELMRDEGMKLAPDPGSG